MPNFLLSSISLARCAFVAALTVVVAGCGGGGAAGTTESSAAVVSAATSDSVATATATPEPAPAQAIDPSQDTVPNTQAIALAADEPAADPTADLPVYTSSASRVAAAKPAAPTPAKTAAAVGTGQQVLADLATKPTAPVATIPAPRSVVQVQSADVIFNVNASSPVANRAGDLQCNGAASMLSNVTSPVMGPNGAGGLEMKYGWVIDPAGTTKSVNYFAIRNTDVDTSGTGNKRCENGLYYQGQFIPWDKDFWFTTAVRTSSLAGTTDQQAIWQWHETSSTSGLSPYLAAFVSGTQLVIQARSNQNSTLTQGNTSVTDLYTLNNWTANTWYQFTVQAKLDSKNNGSSYVRIWLNGVQIVNRVGPLGYKYANPKDYVKNGIYHWTNAGNTWQTQVPKREAWVKGPAMVLDRAGYTADIISTLIK